MLAIRSPTTQTNNQVQIGESIVVPVLFPLLRCSDPWTQEHAGMAEKEMVVLNSLVRIQEGKDATVDEDEMKPLKMIM
ncbi:putative U-box domain-containing protein 4 [Sesbania bispinosa]|nr:putative U-box domain-containing protein 4 [Sesbania bispinosa]